MTDEAREIGELLRAHEARTGRRVTIGTAESATGGRVANEITDIHGSSHYFKGALVAYRNDVKIAVLGVREETIDTYGAVSAETAIEMARGGRRLLGVDICVSDTGIAGPAGATPEKPVGLFYLGLAAEDTSLTEKHMFSGGRTENKRAAVQAALTLLRGFLREYLTARDTAE